MSSGKTRFDKIIDIMKKSRLNADKVALPKPSSEEKTVEGFKSLKKKKTASKNSRLPKSLQRELESSKESLLLLAAHTEEESAIFQSRFKAKFPSDQLYMDQYSAHLNRLAWYYRRIGSGLQKQDLETLERCFETVKTTRKTLESLDVLILHITDPDPIIDSLKKHVLNTFNGNTAENPEENLIRAEENIRDLKNENETQFSRIPDDEKNRMVIEAFEAINNYCNRYKEGINLIRLWYFDKNAHDPARGLIMIKEAQSGINAVLGI